MFKLNLLHQREYSWLKISDLYEKGFKEDFENDIDLDQELDIPFCSLYLIDNINVIELFFKVYHYWGVNTKERNNKLFFGRRSVEIVKIFELKLEEKIDFSFKKNDGTEV